MPRNGIYSLQPHASFVKIVVALTRAVLDAKSAAQRQPGHSRGDPAGRAERPPTPTADCLDRPSFGATVDHRAGACGSAQQRRDQLHDARAASEAGPDLQAVSTPELTAPRERSVGRERRCFIGPLRAAAREAVEARRNPCRQPLLNLPVWAGLRRAWSQAVAPAGLGAAGCVGRGGPRRRSVAGSRLRNGRGPPASLPPSARHARRLVLSWHARR